MINPGEKAEESLQTRIPMASVVLPTHGRRASLLRVLNALAYQETSPSTFEVVVICDGDTDSSAAACRVLTASVPYCLRILEQDTQGPAAARNQGVKAAIGDVIVFLDDDVLPDPTLIASHLAAHDGRGNVASIGPLLPPADVALSLWGAWEERKLCRQYDDMAAGRWRATYRQFYTGNAAVRREHILAVGGFDPSFKRAEDVELALRLRERGTEFIFLPEARGWHYVQRSFQAWLRVPAAYGAADVAMARIGRPQILVTAAEEFRARSFAVRLLTLLCVGRTATIPVVRALGALVRVAARLRLRAVSDPLCSVIFNLEYYHSMARRLGGRGPFLRLLRERDAGSVLEGQRQPRTPDPAYSHTRPGDYRS
jgi:GT2 family glycosyltransferase